MACAGEIPCVRLSKVGAQSIQPIPSYPQANANRSTALVDVYVGFSIEQLVYKLSYRPCRGTEGIFGPYQDVRYHGT